MPEPVLKQAAAEMLDWQGSGMGVMEMSHRGPDFTAIHQQAQADLRELLAIPEQFHILFMQGGGLTENAIVQNLCQCQGRFCGDWQLEPKIAPRGPALLQHCAGSKQPRKRAHRAAHARQLAPQPRGELCAHLQQ